MMGHTVIGEFDVYGVYLPAFAVFAAIAFVLQLAIKGPTGNVASSISASGFAMGTDPPVARERPRGIELNR